MMPIRAAAARAEAGRILRFALVGASVALLYVGCYAVLRWNGSAPWGASPVAFALAIVWQYVAQSLLTFRARPSLDGQSVRFVVVIGAGLAVSTLITGWLGPAADLPEAVSLLAVILWLPLQNYILFRLWVFRGGGCATPGRPVLR